MSKSRKKASKTGQRKNAGRFALLSQQNVMVVFGRMLGRAALIIAVCVLASSTITDSLQKLSERGMAEAARISDLRDFTSFRQQERLALLRRTAADADAVRHLSAADLSLLFGEPSLKRDEPEAESWHFTSQECALDIYFNKRPGALSPKPVYAEYRVRGDVEDSGVVEGTERLDHRSCLRSLYSHAKFPQNQDDVAQPSRTSSDAQG